ncbi:MAG: tetratricopeptide repeat protein [Nannocystaceae bacterium]
MIELEIAFFAERYADVGTLGATALEQAELGPGQQVRVRTLMATALDRSGKTEAAMAAYDRALALAESVRGPDHPQVAMVLANRATWRVSVASDDRDIDALRRVLAIREAAYGPEAPTVGEAWRQLGDAYDARGRRDEGVAAYERAIAIARAAADDSGLYFALGQRARILDDQQRYAEAGVMLDEARSIAERYFGPDSPELARVLVNRGISRLDAGEVAVGAAELERALTIMVATRPADDAQLAIARVSLSRFLARLGRGDEAIALFDAGRQVLEQRYAADKPRMVAYALARAKLLDEVDREREATVQWNATVEAADRLLPEDSPLRLEVLADLAERQLDAGRRDEALVVLRRAQAIDARFGDDPHRRERLAQLRARARG